MCVEVPPVPAYFTEGAVELWNEYAAVMVARGGLSRGDLGILETFVQSLDDYRRFRQILREDGDFIRNASGNLIHHPAGYRMKGAEQQINLAGSALGLSPRGRSGILKEIAANQSSNSEPNGQEDF